MGPQRTEAQSAEDVARNGPLWLATYAGGRGWITYLDLDGADVPAIRRLVTEALDHFRREPDPDFLTDDEATGRALQGGPPAFAAR